MGQQILADVVDSSGVHGKLFISPEDAADAYVQLADGSQFSISRSKLTKLNNDSFYSSSGFSTLTRRAPIPEDSDSSTATQADSSRKTPESNPAVETGYQEIAVVPIIAEELRIGRRTVESGKVRISKIVREHEVIIDEPVLSEHVQVERVSVNRFVEVAPQVRYEGDTMIIPLLEEVTIVEKRLMLKEELHVSKKVVETRAPQAVVLRREEAIVERADTRRDSD